MMKRFNIFQSPLRSTNHACKLFGSDLQISLTPWRDRAVRYRSTATMFYGLSVQGAVSAQFKPAMSTQSTLLSPSIAPSLFTPGLSPKLCYLDLLWICCTTNLQQVHSKSTVYRKSTTSCTTNRTNPSSALIPLVRFLGGFVGQLTDNTTMVVDMVKYATHVQQGVFTTTSLQQIHNKSM